jgi:hypothetical protein
MRLGGRCLLILNNLTYRITTRIKDRSPRGLVSWGLRPMRLETPRTQASVEKLPLQMEATTRANCAADGGRLFANFRCFFHTCEPSLRARADCAAPERECCAAFQNSFVIKKSDSSDPIKLYKIR